MRSFGIRLLLVFYRGLVSPAIHLLAGPGFGCRFQPTCSEYFAEALEQHGLIRGTSLGFKRIKRCHPWSETGEDPVPPAGRKR